MTSVCISNCINDARVPIRATYVNLYKWPESDAEFVRTVSSGSSGDQRPRQHPRVVDSISCRQLYLKSYTFSRKETVPERTKKCLARAKEKVARARRRGKDRAHRKRPRAVVVGRRVRRVKELSCAALCAIFHRLLTCTASVDVVDQA